MFKHVDNSVRDNRQTASIKDGIVKIVNRSGRKVVKTTKFPLAKWESLDVSFGNPNWNKREFIKSMHTIVIDPSPESHCLGERIIDSQIYAINAVFKKCRGIN